MWRLPGECPVCHQTFYENSALCLACIKLLKTTASREIPLENAAFDEVYCSYNYDYPLKELVHKFKYQNESYLRNFLASLISSPTRPQCLIPIPSHPKKIRQRGFNAALELCKKLSKKYKIAFNNKLCRKLRNTPAQAQLSSKMRKTNLKNAFECIAMPYNHIALVDDVLTSGYTAHFLAQEIRQKFGVQKIELWCIARAGFDKS